jgi:hypothetical protein
MTSCSAVGFASAEQRDELAPPQLLELLSVSHQPGSQDIELAMVSQRVRRLFHNPAVVHIPN